MTDRNELAKLYIRRKEYLIGKQLPENERAKITIIPLSLDNMNLFDVKEDSSIEEKKLQSIKLIALSIDSSEEDVKLMSMGFLEEVMETILDANNINSDDAFKRLKKV